MSPSRSTNSTPRNGVPGFYDFLEIRKIIYTTNSVESLNAQFRQVTHRRGHSRLSKPCSRCPTSARMLVPITRGRRCRGRRGAGRCDSCNRSELSAITVGSAPECDHPKDALHVGHFEEVASVERWVRQVLCTRCFAVFREHNIPNRVLGKVWLRQFEGHYGVVHDDPQLRERMSRNIADARVDMLAMIRMLGVDPNHPDEP